MGKGRGEAPSGDLIVFHAGSLAVPLKAAAEIFQKEHHGINVILEGAGSRDCARKISDLHKPCDVFASADFRIIHELLIPDQATWCIKFSGNEMTLVYREKSRRAAEINKDNWYDILLDKNVSFGRSEPDADPCGYRSVLTIKLAEQYYNKRVMAENLLAKDNRYIRPKETDLLALLEAEEIDYIFLYRSVAQQHGFKYLVLPDEINLRKEEFSDFYKRAEVRLRGKAPGQDMTIVGAPIIYGITIPRSSQNPLAAEAFVSFLLDPAQGGALLEKNGQPLLPPCASETYDRIPDGLKKYARAPKQREQGSWK